MSSPRMTPEQASLLSLAEQHEWFRRSTAGNGGRPGRPSPGVRPAGLHLAFGADPATQMSVSWQLRGPAADPFVRIGADPDQLGERIPAEIRALATPVSAINPASGGPVEQYYLHARLAGLEPGRTYYYRVGHRGLDGPREPDGRRELGGLNGSGEPGGVGSFTTAPRTRAPFTFTAFGDQGISDDAVGTTAMIRAQNPAFHLHAGDVSYAESSGRGLITDLYDPRVWDEFFTEIEPAAARVPWQIAVGNHELEAWYSADGYGGQRARFGFPAVDGSAQPPVYYSFTYGNVGFLSLDANDASYEIRANLGYAGGAQAAWLDATLARFRADPEIDFIVVFFHHCAYSTCSSHGSDGGVREQWAPLFDRHAVDLVINGHNHIYERTDPIRGGSATGQAPPGATVHPASAGTTYIVAGAAGKNLYEFPAADSYLGAATRVDAIASHVHEPDGAVAAETVGWSRVRYTGYCLLVIDSEPGWRPGVTARLHVRAVAADGAQIDGLDLVR
jgi:hypothetical protein